MVVNQCKTIVDYSGSSGAMPLFFSIRDCIPYAFEVMLFILFATIFATNYFLIKSRTGRAKVLIGLMASSISTLVLSMMLALAQLVTFQTVLLYTFITIIVFIMFVLSDNS